MPFRAPLKMRRVPQKPVFGTEYLFRTVEACFLHRMLLKTRRVPEEAFLRTARIFGTVGGPLRYRVPLKEQGKGPPETSSALAGRRKWRKGPERTKRVGAVSRTEDASSVAVGCFWHGAPLKCVRFGSGLSTVCGVGCSAGL